VSAAAAFVCPTTEFRKQGLREPPDLLYHSASIGQTSSSPLTVSRCTMSVSSASSSSSSGGSSAPASNIRVYVRVRPLNAREKDSSGASSTACLVAHPSRRTIEFQTKPGDARPPFTYDHVADETATQEDVFQKVGKPITESCLAGYNGTILAYGQTGSGSVAVLTRARHLVVGGCCALASRSVVGR
jgi:hypothetical protein